MSKFFINESIVKSLYRIFGGHSLSAISNVFNSWIAQTMLTKIFLDINGDDTSHLLRGSHNDAPAEGKVFPDGSENGFRCLRDTKQCARNVL
mgnify:CR=1 FL=1